MKILTVLAAGLLLLSPSVRAVQVGATYAQVISEKGTPPGQMKAGTMQILNYPDQTIKLRGGKVVEIGGPPRAATVIADEPKAPAARTGEGQWTTDYQGALAQAKAENRQVFLFFTGSDWCGWCQKLDAEILTTGAFKSYARDNLILVKLDFPHSIPQSEDLKAQNAALAGKFRIEGYPTVIVLNSSGRKVSELGYQPGGPGPFVDALRKTKS